MKWQKRARLGVAIFGIGFGVIVFLAVGHREKATPAPAPPRLDPRAVLESSGAVLQQVRGSKLDFTIEADHQLTYEGGATKLIGVRISINERQGRDFIISGREGMAGENQKELRLVGDVKLASSDGFELTTDRASFSESSGVVQAPGPLAFKKDRMAGSGVGMTYDKNADVLTILDQSAVKLADQGGGTAMEFTAGTATLAREDNYLSLERSVHVIRGAQVIDAEKATATLTDDDQHVTYIELRGSSRVAGGTGTLESMSARDIDLDYTDDGQVLEEVTLRGTAAMAMLDGSNAPRRRIVGGAIDVTLAPDGTVTGMRGQDDVVLTLPANGDSPARLIKAKSLDAAGESGKGLTRARFADNVEYREEPTQGGTPRTARSQGLSLALAGDAVSSAVFTGVVRFEEQMLQASAAEARYQPDQGSLRLTGADQGGRPRVADEQVTIEGDSIDLTLEGRRMNAAGNVKTIMQPRRAEGSKSAKMPGILKEGQPTNVRAESVKYQGASGTAIYAGGAQLWQGDTAIRADEITLDQEKGDLLAVGSARATIALDSGASIGRGEEIRYEDGARRITFRAHRTLSGAAPGTENTIAPTDGPIAPPAGGAIATSGGATGGGLTAQLSGPQGDLRGDRLLIILAKTGSKAERLEAFSNVTLKVDTRFASGSRLTYYADDERYVMTGVPGTPVTVVENCRETSGNTLTFFKSTDRIIVDGNEERRTQTRSGGRCPEPRL